MNTRHIATVTATTAQILTAAATELADHRADRPATEIGLQVALGVAARAIVGGSVANVDRAATAASNAIPAFDGATRSQLADLLRTAATQVRYVDTVTRQTVRVLRTDDDGRIQVQPLRFEAPSEDNGWREAGWYDNRCEYRVLPEHLTPAS